jgi:UDP-3-O-[3-hydroxymyristoyl] N-acetylglucosamine deacetylase
MKNSYQNTIATIITCSGIGVHSGKIVNATFKPAAVNTGICFVRNDIKNKNNIIKADYKNVHKTKLGTSLVNEDGVEVATVEHLMAGIFGANIDNLLIELDNIEIPIFDGSSEPFIFLLHCAGIKKQEEYRKFLKIEKKIKVFSHDNKESFAAFEPSMDLLIDFSIEFQQKIIGKQRFLFDSSKDDFQYVISRARTFGLKSEVDYMRSHNLALGGSLDNAVVVDDDKVLNPDGLRFKDEFVRHKILDVVGDLYLTGMPIIGKYEGKKSGHELNNKLLHKLFSDPSNYSIS